MMKTLIVVHPKTRLSERFVHGELERIGVFASLGENQDDMDRIEARWAGSVARTDISRELEQFYFNEACLFSDHVADLSKKYLNKLYWWLSPYTEKNGYPSEHVISESLLVWLKNYLKSHDHLIFVTSNPFFGLKLSSELLDIQVSVVGKWRFIFSVCSKYVRAVFELTRFFLEFVKLKYYLGRYEVASAQKKIEISRDTTLIRVYVDQNVLGNDGEFSDSHFGDLLGRLNADGKNIVCEPNLSSLVGLWGVFFRWLKEKSKYRFWLPAADISLRNILKALSVSVAHAVFYHRLGARVVLQCRSFCCYSIAYDYIKSLTPIFLKKKGESPRVVLFNWENKGYEKRLIDLFRQYCPRTILRGYMNSFPSPLSAEMGTFCQEALITPYPDELVCMGSHILDCLALQGVPKKILKLGAALRDSYIHSVRDDQAEQGASQISDSILVCLPIVESYACHLCGMIRDFLSLNHSYRVTIKPHPYSSRKVKKSCDELGDRVRISWKSLPEEMVKARHFIYFGSTNSACEAFVLGKNVLKYTNPNTLGLDCLSYFKEQPQSFSTAEDLLRVLTLATEKTAELFPTPLNKSYYFHSNPTQHFHEFIEVS